MRLENPRPGAERAISARRSVTRGEAARRDDPTSTTALPPSEASTFTFIRTIPATHFAVLSRRTFRRDCGQWKKGERKFDGNRQTGGDGKTIRNYRQASACHGVRFMQPRHFSIAVFRINVSSSPKRPRLRSSSLSPQQRHSIIHADAKINLSKYLSCLDTPLRN